MFSLKDILSEALSGLDDARDELRGVERLLAKLTYNTEAGTDYRGAIVDLLEMQDRLMDLKKSVFEESMSVDASSLSKRLRSARMAFEEEPCPNWVTHPHL